MSYTKFHGRCNERAAQALTGRPLIQESVAATIPLPAKVAELVDAQVSGTCG